MVNVMFENGQIGEQLDIGKFDWIQLTYSLFRASRDGDKEEDIACLATTNDWYFTSSYARKHGFRRGPWSDIIIG